MAAATRLFPVLAPKSAKPVRLTLLIVDRAAHRDLIHRFEAFVAGRPEVVCEIVELTPAVGGVSVKPTVVLQYGNERWRFVEDFTDFSSLNSVLDVLAR